MYCKNCGKQMSDQELYCPSCGQDMRPPQAFTPRPDLVPNHLAFSIIMLILFLPFGIAGLIYSLKVDDFLARGDIEGAKYYSGKAKQINVIGLIVLGVLVAVVLLFSLLLVLGIFASFSWSSFNWYH